MSGTIRRCRWCDDIDVSPHYLGPRSIGLHKRQWRIRENLIRRYNDDDTAFNTPYTPSDANSTDPLELDNRQSDDSDDSDNSDDGNAIDVDSSGDDESDDSQSIYRFAAIPHTLRLMTLRF